MLVTHWRWQAGLSCTSGVFARSRTHNARCCLPSHSLLCGSLKPARGPPRERLFFSFLGRPVSFSVSGDASCGCLRARAQLEMFPYSCEKWSQLPPRSGVETDGGRQSNSVLPTRLAPPTRRAPPELNRAFAPEARRGQRLPFSHPDADHHSHSPRHANRARGLRSFGLAWNRSSLNSGPVFSQKRERRC